jgi:YegS/Rv2252/BmrU family lipid kinase
MVEDKRVNVRDIKKIMFILNKNSGGYRFGDLSWKLVNIYKDLTKELVDSEIELVKIEEFSDLARAVKKACENDVEWIIIAGGDGTIRAVNEYLLKYEKSVYLSVYPAGTVNLVCKELKTPTRPDLWVKKILEGKTTPVWLARANDKIFLTVAGIGVDSLVCDKITDKEKKRYSKFAYVFEGLNLAQREFFLNSWKYKFEVMLDDDDIWREATSVLVAKSKYYAGKFSLVNEAALNNPNLFVCLFTGNKSIDFLRYATLVAIEKLELDKTVRIFKAKKVKIRCNTEDFAVELDGDSVVKSPLEISLVDEPVYFID